MATTNSRALKIFADSAGKKTDGPTVAISAYSDGAQFYTWPLGGCDLPADAAIDLMPPESHPRDLGDLVRGRAGTSTVADISANLVFTGTDADTMENWLRVVADSAWTSPMTIFGSIRNCVGAFTGPPQIDRTSWGVIASVQMRVIW